MPFQILIENTKYNGTLSLLNSMSILLINFDLMSKGLSFYIIIKIKNVIELFAVNNPCKF